MPLFYQQDINETTRMAVWEITESEDFFLAKVPLQAAITHPHKRLQHLAGRYLLSLLFPDFPYAAIAIADTRRPFLPDEQYHFSISHCGNYAAAIVSRSQQVGIDVEILTPRVEKIAHKFLHPLELELLHTVGEARIRQLTVLWSAKEAMFKWWGRGAVDFSAHLRIHQLPKADTGTMSATFENNSRHIPLQLDYRVMDQLSIVWVCSK